MENLSAASLELGSSSLLFEEKTKEKEDTSKFPEWSSRYKCIQAYVSFVVSFSTVLHFTITTQEFGVMAIIPYAFFRTFIGIPSVLIEVVLGRYVMGSVVNCWKMCPLGRGVLYCFLVTAVHSALCNNVIFLYLLKYLIYSFNSNLPWEECREFSSGNCYEVGKESTAILKCIQIHGDEFCKNITWESAPEQFWKNVVGNRWRAESVAFSFVILVLINILVLTVNYKGIRSCEKVFNIVVYVPIFLAFIFAFTTFLVPRASFGLKKLFNTNFSSLMEFELWTKSLEDTIISVGLGRLGLNFISSHGNFFDNILFDVAAVFFSDLFCTTLNCIPFLCIQVAMKTPAKLHSNDKLETFIGFSEALVLYPRPKVLWSMIFYFQMALISLGTQIILALAICETLTELSQETLGLFKTSCIYAALSFLLCSPCIFLEHHFNFYLVGPILMTLFLCCFTLEVFYGVSRFNDDFHFMLGYPSSVLLKMAWVTSMVALTAVLIFKIYSEIIHKNFYFFIFLLIPLLIYTSAGIYETLAAHKRGRISSAFMPNPDWGPSSAFLKKSRIIFNSQTVTKEFMYRRQFYKNSFTKPVDFSEQNVVQMA